ncbi:MAG: hypothetical protein EBZ77_10055 [Chitinophagia bacterium]|nr:hypothetical protein [Chitinophagia bacterium]
MNKGGLLLGLVLLGLAIGYSCKKYTDPAPVSDPRLTNPYCNDPDAVNYNWGFPGVPDNSKCFYPTDIFKGTYLFTDSVSRTTDAITIYSQVETLQIFSLSKTRIAITGLCGSGGGDSVFFSAGKSYIATVDTLIGDTTTTVQGQFWCRRLDTVYGTVTYNRLDSLLEFNLQVVSDSGLTTHAGRARRL